MDFLSLYISTRLFAGSVRPWRMALAAVIGAVWALIATIFEAYCTDIFERIFMLVGHVVCAAVITAVSNGERTVKLKHVVSFVAVNVGLGGMMTALYALLGKMLGTSESAESVLADDASASVFIIAALIAALTSLAYGRYRAGRIARKRVSVTIAAFGRGLTVEAMCDSGNMLREPFSGKPVVILSAKRVGSMLPSELAHAACDPTGIAALPDGMLGKIRLIPTKTVTGDGMMLSFTPESISIDGNITDAVVALDVNSDGYEGCDAIVGQELLNL